MKKFTAALLVFVYSLLSPAIAFAATLSLSPASGTFNKNCNFTLSVVVDTQGAQTDGVDAILFYDPARFSATKINNGTIYAEYPGSNIDASAGKITVSGLASTSAPFTGAGTLATIDFTVLAAAPSGVAQVRFDFDPSDKSKTADSNIAERNTVTDILSAVTDGNYTVGSGSCGSTGTSTGQGSISTPSGTIDDLTGNGKPSGVSGATMMLGVVGGVLTILGILGLAFL